MALRIRLKSATGNRNHRQLAACAGFTFVEVMVSLVILCSGIVFIYKSFFLCADYLNNLTCRLYASSLLDEKIGDVAQSFAQWPAKSLDFGDNFVTLQINHKPVTFNYAITLEPLIDVKSVWQLRVNLSWRDGPRVMHATRSAYMMR